MKNKHSWMLVIENCTGCGICFDVCSFKAIMHTKEMPYPEAIEGRCTSCNVCLKECPFDAIKILDKKDCD